MATGITPVHSRKCRTRQGRSCNCQPGYRAWVYDAEAGEKIRKTLPNLRAAKTWRSDTETALRAGKIRASGSATLEEVGAAFLEGARVGLILTRSGDPYKPSAVRGYEQYLRLRVYPKLGKRRLASLRRIELQEFIDELALAWPPASVQAAFIPLRAICAREVKLGRLAVNPTIGVDLPTVRSRRDRFADPVEAEALLAAVDSEDRVIWATAMYAGLRRGEIMALAADRIDLDAGVIHVESGWDIKEGLISTKSHERRRVPLIPELRELVVPHLVRSGRRGDDLAFGKTAHDPFDTRRLSDRADNAWESAGLKRITLHECRHSYAALMIAAGVNAKALQEFMGHSSIRVTMDQYGHLMPGSEDEAAGLLSSYLTRARGAAAS